ncbi:MAG: L-fucose mutarotase [Clostridia bacterium]|nr:L-fucose mutarotase [Clostridia bacterium]
MLKGVSPLISPELLKVLSEMGHGDEIVLSDAHFPGHSVGQRVVRLDGVGMTALLEGVLALIPLDQYDPVNFILMEKVPGDPVEPVIWKAYDDVLGRMEPEVKPVWLERFAYYERAKKAYCVVVTGETAQYANIILKKGVVR